MPADFISIPHLHITSFVHNLRHRRLFDDVQSYVMFIGYPRSAHTLVGFLLDAHPSIAVASQASALKYIKYGFTRNQLFYVMLKNSQRVAEEGRGQRPYSYVVPNQWQGRFERLQVIGDSTGLSRARKNPTLIHALKKTLGNVELKAIHCIRNPYDNISTMAVKHNQMLQSAAKAYFSMCETVEKIKGEIGNGAVYVLRHESLVADPGATLENLCGFLGVAGDGNYYRDCASLIYKSPHKSRLEVSWSPELIADVKSKLSRFGFLADYSYEV